jgi:hypothetical protein
MPRVTTTTSAYAQSGGGSYQSGNGQCFDKYGNPVACPPGPCLDKYGNLVNCPTPVPTPPPTPPIPPTPFPSPTPCIPDKFGNPQACPTPTPEPPCVCNCSPPGSSTMQMSPAVAAAAGCATPTPTPCPPCPEGCTLYWDGIHGCGCYLCPAPPPSPTPPPTPTPFPQSPCCPPQPPTENTVGWLMCCNGVPVPCSSYAKACNTSGSLSACIIHTCLIEHENIHGDQKNNVCPPGQTQGRIALHEPPGCADAYECEAHSVEILCLQNRLEECGNDEACHASVSLYLMLAINRQRDFCENARNQNRVNFPCSGSYPTPAPSPTPYE